MLKDVLVFVSVLVFSLSSSNSEFVKQAFHKIHSVQEASKQLLERKKKAARSCCTCKGMPTMRTIRAMSRVDNFWGDGGVAQV